MKKFQNPTTQITINESDKPDSDLNVTIEGSVQFAHVHFGYTDDKIIINDFSAIVEPGQKIAIVGPTGAGKTTMVKLLMRFYDVTRVLFLLMVMIFEISREMI